MGGNVNLKPLCIMKLQLPITPCVVNNEDHEKTQFFMNIKYIYIYDFLFHIKNIKFSSNVYTMNYKI